MIQSKTERLVVQHAALEKELLFVACITLLEISLVNLFIEKRKCKVGRASRPRHPSGIRGKVYVAGESSHDSMPPLKDIKPLGKQKDIQNRSEAKCWDGSYPLSAVNETKPAMNPRKSSHRAYSQPPRYTNIC